MTPVNTKSLFAHLCIQMEKLDKGEIDASTASAQAKLVAQCNNLLNYELKRAVIINAIESNNAKEHIREIESKKFDSLA
jgi:hypothetical protein